MPRWALTLIEILIRWGLGRAKIRALRKVKAKGIRVYLQVLQAVRRSAMVAIAALIILQLIGVGFAIMVAAGMFLLPLEFVQKMWILFGIGSVMFFVPVIALCYLLSQKLWYKASGAEQMVNDLIANGE